LHASWCKFTHYRNAKTPKRSSIVSLLRLVTLRYADEKLFEVQEFRRQLKPGGDDSRVAAYQVIQVLFAITGRFEGHVRDGIVIFPDGLVVDHPGASRVSLKQTG
jgi:hypothetical protein